MKIIDRMSSLLAQSAQTQKVFNDDVFLVSYPKSGNTWLSFLIANVMCIESEMDVGVNFFNIQDFVPEYQMDSCLAIRQGGVGRFPRIIKSHNEECSLFRKVILITRDPRDVMISYWHYLRGLGQISSNMTIKDLVFEKERGIEAWVRHTRGWMERATEGKRVQIFRYEDFLSDPVLQLNHLFCLLGYDISRDNLEQAVSNSSIDVMKELEKKTRRSRFHLETTEFNFVRKGVISNGEELDGDSMNYICDLAPDIMRALRYL